MKMQINYKVSIVFGVFCLLSCKNNPKETQKKDNSVEKEMAHEWTAQDKGVFLGNCISFLENEGVASPKGYCDCLLDTAIENQPKPSMVFAMEQKDMAKLFNDSKCLDNVLADRNENSWDKELENTFITNCLEAQRKDGITDEKGRSHCDCALEKVKEMVPHPQHFVAIKEDEMKHILDACN